MDLSIKPILTASTMELPQTIGGSADPSVTVAPSSKKLVFKGDDEFKSEILSTRKELGEYSVAKLHSSPLHKRESDQLLLTEPDKLLDKSTAHKESKVINAFEKRKIFVKMLEEPKRFPRKIYSLPTRFDRVSREVDELKHRKCILVSSVSYVSPNVPTKLFRDIGFLLERDNCEVKAIYSQDVLTKLLDNDGDLCKWSQDRHEFVKCKRVKRIGDDSVLVDDREPETTFKGNYQTKRRSYEFKEESISALEDSLNENFNLIKCPVDNELIISYSENSIVGIVVNVARYEKQYKKNTDTDLSSLIVDDILEDCRPIRNLVKKELGVELDVFLYNPDTCELSFLKEDVQRGR